MQDQYIDETLILPWRLTCTIACRALVNRRSFDEQAAAMTEQGMAIHEVKRARYLQMKRQNRQHESA